MLFVSYSTRDLAAVERIVTRLEARGLTCWYAARDIPPAAIFAKAIADAVAHCDGFVAVISKASQASDAVLRELELASNGGKAIYPLRLEAGALAPGFDYYLSLKQWTEYGSRGDAALDWLAAALAGQPSPALPHSPRLRGLRRWAMGLAALAGLAAAGYLLSSALPKPAVATPQASMQEARIALRELDVNRLNALIARGWSPNAPFDEQDNNALDIVLAICEWNPQHDRQKLILTVRTLLEAGASVTHRNTWGDTAYSIAKAPRYCGPDHPVTQMMKASCYNGFNPTGDQCEAHYHKPGS